MEFRLDKREIMTMLDPIKRKLEETSKQVSSKAKSKILNDIEGVIRNKFVYTTKYYYGWTGLDYLYDYVGELCPEFETRIYNNKFVFYHNGCVFMLKDKPNSSGINVIIYGLNCKSEGKKLEKYISDVVHKRLCIYLPKTYEDSTGNTGMWIGSRFIDRAFDTNVFSYKNGIIKYILDTVEENFDDVRECDINHHMSILLHGESGIGKTVTAEAMVNYMGNNGECLDDLDNAILTIRHHISDSQPHRVFSHFHKVDRRLRRHKIFIFENIDDQFTEENYSKVIRLLQYLEKYDNNMIIIYTARDYSKLNEDIIKRLKLDYTIELEKFDYNLAVQMCFRLEVDPLKVLKDIQFPINPSELQQYILNYRMNSVKQRRLRDYEKIQ